MSGLVSRSLTIAWLGKYPQHDTYNIHRLRTNGGLTLNSKQLMEIYRKGELLITLLKNIEAFIYKILIVYNVA